MAKGKSRGGQRSSPREVFPVVGFPVEVFPDVTFNFLTKPMGGTEHEEREWHLEIRDAGGGRHGAGRRSQKAGAQ